MTNAKKEKKKAQPLCFGWLVGIVRHSAEERRGKLSKTTTGFYYIYSTIVRSVSLL